MMVLVMLGVASAVECGSIPTDNCAVSVSTTFAQNTYSLNNGIFINGSNIVLDLNGSTLEGSFSNTGIRNKQTNDTNNVTITNGVISSYRYGIAPQDNVGFTGSFAKNWVVYDISFDTTRTCLDANYPSTQDLAVYNTTCGLWNSGDSYLSGTNTHLFYDNNWEDISLTVADKEHTFYPNSPVYHIYNNNLDSIIVDENLQKFANFTNNTIPSIFSPTLSFDQSVGGKVLWTGTDGVTYNVTTLHLTNTTTLPAQNIILTDGIHNKTFELSISDNIIFEARGSVMVGKEDNSSYDLFNGGSPSNGITFQNLNITGYGKDGQGANIFDGSEWNNMIWNNVNIFAEQNIYIRSRNLTINNSRIDMPTTWGFPNVRFNPRIRAGKLEIHDSYFDVDEIYITDVNSDRTIGDDISFLFYNNYYNHTGDNNNLLSFNDFSDVEIYNNTFYKIGLGDLGVFDGTVAENYNVTIRNNTITGGQYGGIDFYGAGGVNKSLVRIFGNTITNSEGWFQTQKGNDFDVYDNSFTNVYFDSTMTDTDFYSNTVSFLRLGGEETEINICNGGVGNTYTGSIDFIYNYSLDNSCESITVPNGIKISSNSVVFDGNDVQLSGSGSNGVNVTVNNSIIKELNITGYTNSLIFNSETNNNIFRDSKVEDPYFDYGTGNNFTNLDVPDPALSGLLPAEGGDVTDPQDFNYTVTTVAEMDFCNLYLNDVLEDAESSFTVNLKSTDVGVEVSGLDPFVENEWYVLCYDVFGNLVNSGTMTTGVTVGQHSTSDVTGLVIDTAVEVGREYVRFAPLVGIVTIGVVLLFIL